MADNKKSFVLYSDLIHTVKKMKDVHAGQLFKIILSYVNDENPVVENALVDLVFEPIKRQLKRDLIKYEGKKLQWSQAGKASAEKRKETKKKATVSTDVKKRSTVSTVNVNVNDNVNVNVIQNKTPTLFEIENYLLSKISEKEFSEIKNSLRLKYESWTENGWKDGHGKAIVNWKSKILNTLPYLKKEHGSTQNKSGHSSTTVKSMLDTFNKLKSADSDKLLQAPERANPEISTFPKAG